MCILLLGKWSAFNILFGARSACKILFYGILVLVLCCRFLFGMLVFGMLTVNENLPASPRVHPPPPPPQEQSPPGGGSPSTAANDKPEPTVDDHISRETTLADFVNFLPSYDNGMVRTVQVLRNETLLSKYALLQEKRRKKMGLSGDQADPLTILYMEKVEEIMNEWQNDFWAQPAQQWKLSLPETRKEEPAMVGAS